MTTDIVEMLKEPRMVKVCAPMVRYSKLQFRTLVRNYNCDICFSPMILADSFVQSDKARQNEFTTSKEDNPLIVQFAAKNVYDFVCASEMVSPYCQGVDLNCGCPQRWAMKDGYGSHLLTKPQLVKDLVQQVRNRISKPFSVSVKIRLLKDIKQTVNLCQLLERAGASFLTVHGRTPDMRNEPVELDNMKLIRDCVQLPLIANGDAKCLKTALMLYEDTKYDAVMSARGILANPAMYSGYTNTPLDCVQDWLNITYHTPTQFLCFHHHLVFMLEKILPKKARLLFNTLQCRESVLEFLYNEYKLKPNIYFDGLEPTVCDFSKWNGLNTIKEGKAQDNDFNDILGNIFQE